MNAPNRLHRSHYRPPTLWHWGRILGYLVIPVGYVVLLFWAMGPVTP